MIVYAESNFLFEWILQRSVLGMHSVERIVELVEAGKIRLGIPGCAFAEVRTTLERRGKDGKSLEDAMEKEAARAGGSDHGQRIVELYAAIRDSVREQAVEHLKRHDFFAARCFHSAQILELNVKILSRLPETISKFDLEVQDALVLATILADAESKQQSETKIFVQKDKEDFNKPNIKNALNALGCDCIWGFESTVKRIEADILSAS